jgi:hypothetical protein
LPAILFSIAQLRTLVGGVSGGDSHDEPAIAVEDASYEVV